MELLYNKLVVGKLELVFSDMNLGVYEIFLNKEFEKPINADTQLIHDFLFRKGVFSKRKSTDTKHIESNFKLQENDKFYRSDFSGLEIKELPTSPMNNKYRSYSINLIGKQLVK